MARKIVVVSTRDNARKEFNTDVRTWGELKPLIEAERISTSDMKATVRETKVNLDHHGAMLPEGDFTLFLTPGKVKSGN